MRGVPAVSTRPSPFWFLCRLRIPSRTLSGRLSGLAEAFGTHFFFESKKRGPAEAKAEGSNRRINTPQPQRAGSCAAVYIDSLCAERERTAYR